MVLNEDEMFGLVELQQQIFVGDSTNHSVRPWKHEDDEKTGFCSLTAHS